MADDARASDGSDIDVDDGETGTFFGNSDPEKQRAIPWRHLMGCISKCCGLLQCGYIW